MKRILLISGIGMILLSACGQTKISNTSGIGNDSALTSEGTETPDTAREADEIQSEDSVISEATPTVELNKEANCRVKTSQQIGYTVLPRPNETDHSRGPDDAYVTFIEYGDFQ